VVLGALRGLQDVENPNVHYLCVLGYWLPYFLLFENTELKAVGIWIGLLAGLTAAALFLYIRFARLTRKLVMQNENK
jgi:MATE family multidrug resistance protein